MYQLDVINEKINLDEPNQIAFIPQIVHQEVYTQLLRPSWFHIIYCFLCRQKKALDFYNKNLRPQWLELTWTQKI